MAMLYAVIAQHACVTSTDRKCDRLSVDQPFVLLTYTSNKNIHFEMILDVGIGEKRKETRFLI